MDTRSIEILTRWQAEHTDGAIRHERMANLAVTKRDRKKHTEQAQMHRDNAALCARRLDEGRCV